MPKKTLPKVPDYIGVPTDETKLIVQKSNPLKSLSETGMSLAEFKILDAYLSRIDSHNPDKRLVRFEKGELEKILGVTRILQDDLVSRLDGLFKPVNIRDKRKDGGFIKIGLFEKAEAKQDLNGLWQVDLMCTPSAMEYIFNIEVMGYLPYMLKNIIELTSRYSYVLFIYLESRRQGSLNKTWKISIDELKKMLRCTSETYNSFKRFNDLVLKKCHKEINKKTDLRFNYQPTDRVGRKFTNIQFSIENIEESQSLVTLELDTSRDSFGVDWGHIETNEGVDYGDELCELLGCSACDNEFDAEQVKTLRDLVVKMLPSADNFGRDNYLSDMVELMNTYKPKGSPKRFEYLCKMLRSAIKSKENNSSSYDLDEYERWARNYDFSDASWNQATENNE